MRKMSVLIVAVVGIVVVVFAAGAIACGGLWKSIGTAYVDDYSSTAQIDEIHVSGKTLAVEFRPATGSGVTIQRTARYLNYFHGRPAQTHRIEGTVLELGGDDSATFASIEYVVTAPAGVRVTGDFGTGSVDVSGVSSVDVKLGTGSIAVADATGDVTARTDTGSITLKGVRSSAVVATSKTGAVSVDLATAANVEASTETGSVDVVVPAGSYRIDARTGMGELKLGIPNDPNGAYRLALSTKLGRVTLAAH